MAINPVLSWSRSVGNQAIQRLARTGQLADAVLAVRAGPGNQAIQRLARRGRPAPVEPPSVAIQRYIDGARVDLPGARVSRYGEILLASKKDLFATKARIDQGNEQFGDKANVVFQAGAPYAEENSFARYLAAADLVLHRVMPKSKGKKKTEVDPMMKVVSNLNLAVGDWDWQGRMKSRDYESFVEEQMAKLQGLEKLALAFLNRIIQEPPLVHATNRNTSMSFGQYKAFKDEVLEPWMRDNQVAAKYLDEARLHVTYEPGVDPPPSITDISNFVDQIGKTRRAVLTAELDRAKENEFILPTDCFTAALALGATHTKNKPNPAIGETHFVDLPGDTGWQNHWATVILRDGEDTVTMENAAGVEKAPLDRSTWWFGMYGTDKKEQSFEEEYKRLSAERTAGLAGRIKGIANARQGYTAIVDSTASTHLG